LGPIGSAVLTFIGYKQTDKQTDRQAKFIYRLGFSKRQCDFQKTKLIITNLKFWIDSLKSRRRYSLKSRRRYFKNYVEYNESWISEKYGIEIEKLQFAD